MTDAEIEAAYVQSMLDAQDKAKTDSAHLQRLHQAAKGLIEHMRLMQLKTKIRNAYVRNLQILYQSACAYLKDIKFAPKRNWLLNPVKETLKNVLLNQKALACWNSGATKERATLSGNEVQEILEREEQAKVNSNAERKPNAFNIVNLLRERKETDTNKMFCQSKINNLFLLTYLCKACIKAKILDIRRRLMPYTQLLLYWW